MKARKDIMCSDVQNGVQSMYMMIKKTSRVSYKALNLKVQAKDNFDN